MTYSMTINTDASFDPRTKMAGWAYWIKSHDQLFKASGLIHGTNNSSTAELTAIAKAIRVVGDFVEAEWGSDFPKENVTLYINTDSTWSIAALEGRFKRSKHQKFVEDTLKNLPGFTLVPRHVKAHSHTDTARHWVNDWCDRQAKKQLKAALGK